MAETAGIQMVSRLIRYAECGLIKKRDLKNF